MRTLLALEAFGVIDRYGEVFDLDSYWRHRDAYLRYLQESKKPSERDVLQLAIQSRIAAIGARKPELKEPAGTLAERSQ